MIVGYERDESGRPINIHFIGGGTTEDKEKAIKELMDEYESYNSDC